MTPTRSAVLGPNSVPITSSPSAASPATAPIAVPATVAAIRNTLGRPQRSATAQGTEQTATTTCTGAAWKPNLTTKAATGHTNTATANPTNPRALAGTVTMVIPLLARHI